MIENIEARNVEEKELENGELVEISRDFLAIEIESAAIKSDREYKIIASRIG